MQSKASTVAQYLAGLPPDRRAAISAVRRAVLDNLDRGFAEGMQYGMIGYYVPHSIYPAGYHCNPEQPLPFAALASQKNHMAVYLMSVYADPAEERWLRERWTGAGKKLDMGKCCIRFRRLEDVPLEVLGEAIARVSLKSHVARYESALRPAKARPSKPKRGPAKATAPHSRKAPAKKAARAGKARRSR
ncbi:MAG: DUF1801 domain-containing protein [Phycisphaerae bacterium]|nr:DUF1801 domain-containing protein [Phycisphaerae bacterium]